MNSAHLHLVLVHLPIVMAPLGAAILAFGMWRSNDSVKAVALSIFIAASLFATAAFSVGEGAEEAVEDLPGIVESKIEAHEEAAEFALWLTIALGLSGVAGLAAQRLKPAAFQALGGPILGLALISSGALAFAAQEGGKIRHPEAFPQGSRSDMPGRSDED